MQVHVFRHGESLSNAGGRTADPALIPLTETGHAEARALAASLRFEPDLLLISPFLRTDETARPIAERFPAVKLEVWPIQEFTYLAPAACIDTSWIERKPMTDAYWGALNPVSVDGPGAENFISLLDRARAFLTRLAGLDARQVIVISHGQFMQATKLMAEQPTLDPKTAMQVFVDRQAVASFPNCAPLILHRMHRRMTTAF